MSKKIDVTKLTEEQKKAYQELQKLELRQKELQNSLKGNKGQKVKFFNTKANKEEEMYGELYYYGYINGEPRCKKASSCTIIKE